MVSRSLLRGKDKTQSKGKKNNNIGFWKSVRMVFEQANFPDWETVYKETGIVTGVASVFGFMSLILYLIWSIANPL